MCILEDSIVSSCTHHHVFSVAGAAFCLWQIIGPDLFRNQYIVCAKTYSQTIITDLALPKKVHALQLTKIDTPQV